MASHRELKPKSSATQPVPRKQQSPFRGPSQMTQTKVFNNFADFDRVDSIARHKEPETHKTSIRNSLEANDSDFEGQLASLQSTKQIVTGLNRLTEQEQLQMQWRVNRRVDEEETQLDRKY